MLTPIIGDLDELKTLYTQQQRELADLRAHAIDLRNALDRLAPLAATGHALAKTLYEVQKGFLGEKFEEHWKQAHARAFPPPAQQSQAETEKAIAAVREETQRQIAELREQVEAALNETLRKVVTAVELQQHRARREASNVIPMPAAPAAPKAKSKSTKNAPAPAPVPKPTEMRDGVGVDRDEPV